MAVQNEAFVDLEESLTAEILPRWAKIQRRIEPQIVKAIQDRNLAKVAEILDTINPELFYQGKLRKIETLLSTGLVFGAALSNNNETQGITITNDPDVMGMSEMATEQFKTMLRLTVNAIRARYMRMAEKSIERLEFEDRAFEEIQRSDTNVKKAKGNIQRINIPDVVGDAGKIGQGQLSIVSSLQMSRMSQYGFLNEAEATGATTYRVNEQLDGRTCPVCRRMHGKEFEVGPALAKVDTLIRITDTDDLKTLAPFPKQNKASLAEIDASTNEQLRARGLDTPPYHPNCRGLLQKVPDDAPPPEALDELVPLGVPDELRPLTEAETKTYRGLVSQSDIWNNRKFDRGYQNMLEDGFSEEEAWAMLNYTGGGYRNINNYLKGATVDDRPSWQTDEYFELNERLFNNALKKMPTYQGTVIREVRSRQTPDEWKAQLGIGSRFEGKDNGFLSTSYERGDFQIGTGDLRTLKESIVANNNSYLWFEIEGQTGVKVGRYSRFLDDEKEVIFPTDAKFEVVSVYVRGENAFHVKLREVV